jgi:hypothetical protein
LGNIKIEEFAPAAQTCGRFDSEPSLALKPQAPRHYEIVSEASYYARLIAEAEREGRIGDFPHDPRASVDTASTTIRLSGSCRTMIGG